MPEPIKYTSPEILDFVDKAIAKEKKRHEKYLQKRKKIK